MEDPLEWKELGRSGLANLGNTCYINTSIQCLSHCNRFLQQLLTSRDDEAVESCPYFKLINEFRDLLKDMWIHKHSLIPKRFVRFLKDSMNESLNVYEQNDLPEFVMLFIDRLCNCIGKNVPSAQLEEIDAAISKTRNSVQLLTLHMQKNWLMSNRRDLSWLKDTFYGQQVMQILCENCEHITHNYEVFFMLSLSLPEKRTAPCTLSELLDDHMKTEHLPEWTCERCKHNGKCAKTYRFWNMPEVMIITIKRFTPALKKLNTEVTIDEDLDLSDLSIYDNDGSYKLRSIACHMGSIHGGHYYALCHHPDGAWYHIDDVSVSKLKESPTDTKMFARDFYVLFYEKSM
jgi:ubiquitin carboxyl-terminal hydrolase 2